MAKLVDKEIHPTVLVEGLYYIVGEVTIRAFHQTARIEVYGFLNKDARKQLVPGAEQPIHREGIEVYYEQYMKYFTPAKLSQVDNDPIAAAYMMLANEPYPIGRAEFFSSAEDV
jgi:hypothetical protein